MTNGSEEDKAAEKMRKVTQELGRWQVSVDCFVLSHGPFLFIFIFFYVCVSKSLIECQTPCMEE